MYKIIGTDGQQYGPAGVEQIRVWIAQNRLNAQTLAQSEGSTEWKPLISFAELAPELKIAPLPATAQVSDRRASYKIGIMTPKTLLRTLLIADFIMVVMTIITSSGTPYHGAVQPLAAVQWVYAPGMVIASSVAGIGLFFFWRPARPIFLATIIIDIIATAPILGVTSNTLLGDSLSTGQQYLDGFILAVVYLSPVRDLFQRPKGQP